MEDVAYCDGERLGLFARKAGGREPLTLEIREADLARSQLPGKAPGRASFQKQLLAMLSRQYPGWRFERVSHRSDRRTLTLGVVHPGCGPARLHGVGFPWCRGA